MNSGLSGLNGRQSVKSTRIGAFLLGAWGTCSVWGVSSAHAQAAPMCEPTQVEQIRHSTDITDLNLKCSLTLSADAIIARRVVIAGEEASGLVLDCAGGMIVAPEAEPYSLLIQSRRNSDGSWSAPRHVQVKNCTIVGGTRIVGMGINGQAEAARQSSLTAGHIERAQAAAPVDVQFDNVIFQGRGTIPLYIAPGVTHTAVRHSKITGHSVSTAVYLDAESAYTELSDTAIDTQTRRELLAVDGSAHNLIVRNRFVSPVKGGIYLYRNCGEGGTVRHQAPQFNRIEDNTFDYRAAWGWRPAVWIGSRAGWVGWRSYCAADSGYSLGSSVEDGDFADHNVVQNNIWLNRSIWWSTLDWGAENVWSGNRRE